MYSRNRRGIHWVIHSFVHCAWVSEMWMSEEWAVIWLVNTHTHTQAECFGFTFTFVKWFNEAKNWINFRYFYLAFQLHWNENPYLIPIVSIPLQNPAQCHITESSRTHTHTHTNPNTNLSNFQLFRFLDFFISLRFGLVKDENVSYVP